MASPVVISDQFLLWSQLLLLWMLAAYGVTADPLHGETTRFRWTRWIILLVSRIIFSAVLAFVLILVFGFAMIWFGILIGSVMRSVEAVNGVMFSVLFPITFLANTFAPTEPMQHWLRVMAEWNPVSSLAQAMRELWGNGGPAPESAQLPLHHPVLATILWSLALTAVFAPFALRAYARRTGG